MNWYILGAGAQGLLWGSALTQAGVAATLLMRREPPGAECELILERHGRCQPLRMACAGVASQALAPAGALQRLLVTVKATDVETALNALGDSRATLQLVVLLQNGLGAEAIARRLLPEQTVIWLGTSTHGSFRRSANHVVKAGTGSIWLGPGRGSLPAAAQAAALASLQATELNVQWDDAIATRLWHKLAANACINPLTALFDCRNGELLSLPQAQRWLPALAAEAAAVISAEGHSIGAAELLTSVQTLAQATAGNYNSMQQDYHAGRTTEIGFITGTLLAAAQRHGLAAPHHAELLTRVQQRQPFPG